MSEWRICQLGDVVEVIGGGTPKTSVPEYWNGEIPWLSVADFNTGQKYVYNADKHITRRGVEKSSTKILKKGKIIISARGTVGVISMLGRDMAFNQSCYGIQAKVNHSINSYIFYLLKNVVNELKQVSHGGVFDTITRNTFDKIAILLPPLPEQKAIAEVLSSLDDKIDLLHRQNKTLESLAETLFRHYFIDNAQDDWEEKTLDEITDIAIGRTPPRLEFQWFSRSASDIKWISIKDLGAQGVFLFNTDEYLTRGAVEKFRIPIIPENTVVLSFKMTLGRVGITSERMLSNEAIAHFKIKDENIICKEFLYIFLKQFKYDMLGSTSSIVTSINSGMINKIPIIIPGTDSMIRFKVHAQQFFNKIRENQKQIQILEKLRNTLLPKLISGNIRVQYNEEAR